MKHFLLFLLISLPIWGYAQSWSGDTNKFKLSGDYRMLNDSKSNGTVHLSKKYPSSSTTENFQWEFSLYFKTKPTSNNYIDVYPISSSNSEKGPLLHIGKNNYTDIITFSVAGKEESATFKNFKSENYQDTQLSVTISVQEGRLWNITLSLHDQKNNVKETQRITLDAQARFPHPAYFYVEMTHTMSNPKHFGISDKIIFRDNITQPEEPEEENPTESPVYMDKMTSVGYKKVKLYFSDEINIEKASFYIKEGDSNKKEKVKGTLLKGNCVELNLSKDMQDGNIYTFYWEGIIDAKGLPIKDGSKQVKFVVDDKDDPSEPEKPDDEDDEEETPEKEEDKEEEEKPEVPTESFSKGDIRINEVMANPNGFEPETEYIELYNTLDREVKMTGWILKYGDKTEVALDEVTIQPNSYIVLYRTEYDEFDLSPDLVCALDGFPRNLANAGKDLELRDGTNKLISQYTYPNSNETGGISWEYSEEGWHLSSDPSGGTPGKVNSDGIEEEEPDEPEDDDEEETTEKEEDNEEEEEVSETPAESFSEGDIRINEVMADPNGFEPKTEYIELYNTLDKKVRMTGWILTYGTTDVALDEVTIQPNNYIVLYRTGDEEFDLSDDLVCALDKFPANLTNSGKELALYDGTGELIDQYTYPKAKPGHSWEYTDGEWHLSSDPSGGTPGDANSDGVEEEESDESEEPDEDDEDESEDDEEDTETSAESFSEGDIRINEVMADPTGFEPRTEYIELYNTLNKKVKMSEWVLTYGTTKVALDEVTIQAQSYIVLYRTGDEEFDLSPDLVCALDKFPANLTNSGKELALYDGTGELIDQYTYPEAEKGISWEYSENGWFLSMDPSGGTPGRANSEGGDELTDTELPEPGELVINEILPEPYTGGSEYIELLNLSERDLSLAALCISTRKKDGSLSTAYPLSGSLESGEYLLLSKSVAGVEEFYDLPTSAKCLECKLPVLSNDGASVVLYRKEDEEIIDEVTYSPKWHASSVKNKKGVSLERIDPEGDSQDADNWTSAASSIGYGTPGAPNSQHLEGGTTVTGNDAIISDPIYQLSGNYQISYQLPQAGYEARGWIFDMNGRRVSVLADRESLGTSGVLTWNGIGQDGSPLPSGVYILYIELWHTNGSKPYSKKAAFLVH